MLQTVTKFILRITLRASWSIPVHKAVLRAHVNLISKEQRWHYAIKLLLVTIEGQKDRNEENRNTEKFWF